MTHVSSHKQNLMKNLFVGKKSNIKILNAETKEKKINKIDVLNYYQLFFFNKITFNIINNLHKM